MTTLGQSGPGSNGNEEEHQSSRTEASPQMV